MPRVLIIAYGNPLRSDDGVAWRAAEQLQDKLPSDEVEIQALHQLGPELAESISRSGITIFIDAAAGPGQSGEVQIQQLDASAADPPRFYHSLSPATVLAMAKQLYGTTPTAYSITVMGENFEHGEQLSADVQAAVLVLISQVEDLVRTYMKS